MANNKNFVVNNPVSVGTSAELTIGNAPTVTTGVNLSSAILVKGYSVATQDSQPSGVFFKPDGTRMYMVGPANDRVWQYNLSTAWDVTTATVDGTGFSVAGQDLTPRDLVFSPDGTKMFVTGDSGDTVEQYTLTTAWDTTGTVTHNDSQAAGVTGLQGIDFNDDGTKMYVTGSTGVVQHTLDTAYDLTGTVTNNGVVWNDLTSVTGIRFNSDGTEVYIVTLVDDTISRYSVATAYDLSDTTFIDSLRISTIEAQLYGIYLKPDDTRVFTVGIGSDTVYEFNLEADIHTFDLSTGNYFTTDVTQPTDFVFSNAADVQTFQLEVTGDGDNYSIPSLNYTGKNFSVASQDTAPNGVFFKPDGKRMWVVGSTNDRLYQYDLSTAWDVTTASYSTFTSVADDGTPVDIFFKPDGTRFYVIGASADRVHQYDLSNPWDISSGVTINPNNFANIANEDTSPQAIYLKPDGTKLYVAGDTGNTIEEYTVSTAWDMGSTITNTHTFSVSIESQPNGLWFKSDGTEMYVVGAGLDSVLIYFLSTAWDLSTAYFSEVEMDLQYDATPEGVYISPDGTRLYMVGTTGDAVYQYDIARDTTSTWDSAIQWSSGVTPDAVGYGEKDIYTFVTDDGGTTYSAFPAAVNIS